MYYTQGIHLKFLYVKKSYKTHLYWDPESQRYNSDAVIVLSVSADGLPQGTVLKQEKHKIMFISDSEIVKKTLQLIQFIVIVDSNYSSKYSVNMGSQQNN